MAKQKKRTLKSRMSGLFLDFSHLMDESDWFVLKKIEEFGDLGTIKLAEKVGIAPKNLLLRLDIYIKNGWIKNKSIPVKPSGAKKVWLLTTQGRLQKEKVQEDFKKSLEFRKLNEKAEKELKKL